MIKILNDLCDSKELACFFSNYDKTDSFDVGIVLAVNIKEIAIQLVSPYGIDDGIVVININNIFRIEKDGQYIEKIKKLCSGISVFESCEQIDENNISNSLLKIACRTREIVSLELVDSGYMDVTGFIESIDEDECIIKQVDEYGYENGYSYVGTNNITEIAYSGEAEKRVLKLWKKNNTGDGSVC